MSKVCLCVPLPGFDDRDFRPQVANKTIGGSKGKRDTAAAGGKRKRPDTSGSFRASACFGFSAMKAAGFCDMHNLGHTDDGLTASKRSADALLFL